MINQGLSSEAPPLSSIGGNGTQVRRGLVEEDQLTESLADLAGLRMSPPDPVADFQGVRCWTGNGCLDLAGSSFLSRRRPAGQIGVGTRDFPTGPEARYPPENTVRTRSAGMRTTGRA
jgi:hypothetical protein